MSQKLIQLNNRETFNKYKVNHRRVCYPELKSKTRRFYIVRAVTAYVFRPFFFSRSSSPERLEVAGRLFKFSPTTTALEWPSTVCSNVHAARAPAYLCTMRPGCPTNVGGRTTRGSSQTIGSLDRVSSKQRTRCAADDDGSPTTAKRPVRRALSTCTGKSIGYSLEGVCSGDDG